MPRALWWSWGGGAVSYERGTPVLFHGLYGREHTVAMSGSVVNALHSLLYSSSLLSSLELSDTKSMSLKYEPSSEPLHISAK